VVAAVSGRILERKAVVDLNYEEDKVVSVDFNLWLLKTANSWRYQSSVKKRRFRIQLDELLTLGRKAIAHSSAHSALFWRELWLTRARWLTECAIVGRPPRRTSIGVLALAFQQNALQLLPEMNERLLPHYRQDGELSGRSAA